MNRRGFLGSILAAGVAPAYVSSSILMPVKKIIVPGSKFLTADEITREALRILENNLKFSASINTEYDQMRIDSVFDRAIRIARPKFYVRSTN